MSSRTTILMYHRVSEPPDGSEEGDYALPTALFDAQARWLAGCGRPVVPLASLLERSWPDRSVVLTFDDGFETDATVAAPLLAELGVPATFFVSADLLGRPGYLSWSQLRGLAEQGLDVGSHGLDHALFADLGEVELRRQLADSKRRIEERLGRRIDAVSLPGGSGGHRAFLAARAAGYRLVLGSRPGLVEGPAPAGVLPRVVIRRGHDLQAFRAAVEQPAALRLRQGLRYGVTQLARTLVGTRAFGRLRSRWLRRALLQPPRA